MSETEEARAELPDLLPCPFCGERLTRKGDHWTHISLDCPIGFWSISARWLRHWNKRSPAAPTQQGGLAVQDVLLHVRRELYRAAIHSRPKSYREIYTNLYAWVEAKLKQQDSQNPVEIPQ